MSDMTRAEQLRDRIKHRMHDIRYGDENEADLDELVGLTYTPGEQAERWKALHGFLEDSCRLVIDGKAVMRRLGERIEFTMLTDEATRPPSLVNEHPELGPCKACDDTGWCWSSGPFGQGKGEWRFCKECKWRRR